jgi:hypothetical protein
LKLLTIITAVVLSLLLFLAINIFHFRFFPVHVVLYDSLIDVVIAAVASVVFYLLLRRRLRMINIYEAGLCIALTVLIAVNYSVSVPTIIDRSLSVYILEKLQQRGGSIRESAFEEILTKEFFPEHRLVDIRLTEQMNSGTITIDNNNCVRLTARGDRIANFTRWYRATILPKHREIMGKLSDDLTDPFRNSIVRVPYECKE